MTDNWAAEENVLGAMMLSRPALQSALEVLEPNGEHKFARSHHRVLYAAMRWMDQRDEPVDLLSLHATLESHDRLEAAGGEQAVRDIATIVAASGNVAHHARIVREAWAQRQVEAALQVPVAATAAARLELLERAAMDTRARIEFGQDKAFATAYDLSVAVEERSRNPPKSTGIPTPFSSLPPLEGGRLYIVAGYTGDGKTVVAIQYAKAAAKNRFRVGFFTVEMSKQELWDRFIATFGVPFKQVASGNIGVAYQENFKRALAETATWQVEVYDTSAANSAMFQRFQRVRRYDLIIVDHLHEIALEGRAADHRVMLEREVRNILALAKQENIPVVLLAQLSRSSNNANPWPMPNLTMLRESARIEQEAHMVCFVWRERDKMNQPLDEAWLIVSKNRSGPSGFRRALDFIGDQVRFVEADREDVG